MLEIVELSRWEKDYKDIWKPFLGKAKREQKAAVSVQVNHNLFNVLFLSLATGFFLSANTVRSVATFLDAVGPSATFGSSFNWESVLDCNCNVEIDQIENMEMEKCCSLPDVD